MGSKISAGCLAADFANVVSQTRTKGFLMVGEAISATLNPGGRLGRLGSRVLTVMDNDQFNVLLVEDDLNDIFLVKRAFKMAQLATPLQVVTDGQEAIAYLRGDGKYADRGTYPLPQLIVMDIKMPRKSGFEVLAWVKRDEQPLRRIPIVIVSS